MTNPKSNYDEILERDTRVAKAIGRAVGILIFVPTINAAVLWLLFPTIAFWKWVVVSFILSSLFYSNRSDLQS